MASEVTDGKINALQNLETLGVSLVKRGANKKKFAFTKADNSAETTTMPSITEVLQTIVKEGDCDTKKVGEIAKSKKLTDKGAAALEAIAKMRDAFAEEPGMNGALALLLKGDDDSEDPAYKKKKGMEDGSEDNSAETQSEEEEESRKKKAKKTRKDADGDDDGDVAKDGDDESDDESESRKAKKALAKSLEGLPEMARNALLPILKAQEDRLAELHGTVRKQQAVIKAQTDAQAEREWLTKCEKQVTHIPGKTPAALAKSLKKMADTDKAAADDYFETLRKSSDALRKSAMFRDAGAGNTGGSSASAYDMIQAKAAQLVEKGEGKITHERAITKVMEMFPDLYEQSQVEQAERVKNR